MPYIKALGFVFLAALSTSVIAADRELLVSGFPDYPDIKVTHGQDFVDAHPILSQQMGRNGEGYLIDAGVADWSPEKWASLVPEQVPDIRSACPNNPTSGVWLFDPDFPDQMTCDGLVFPDNPAYPEQSEVMLTPWGTETTIRFHQDVDGKRYYLRGQLDVERFEFLDKKPKDLARAWHQNKDTDPIKAAKYAASVEAILLEYARVFPTYLPVLKNSHYYDTGGSHLADGEIVPANKPAFPAGGSLWIRWPSNASLPYELADVYDIAYASPGMDKIVPGETKTLREMFEDNVLDTAVNYVLAFEWRYHISGNISSHFSGMVRFARIMGRPDYARFVYDAINYAQTLYENGWDQVATQGLGYHRLWMDNPTGAAYALNYYSDPAGYLDEQGERFDFLDLRTPINMQRMRLNWSALILPNGYDTPVHDGVNDANRPLYNARVNHSETRILAAFGEAALSDGVDTQQVEAHLHWSGGNNHAHQDMLNIYLFGHGRELFGDLLESPTHSTVYVDGNNSYKGDAAHDNRGNLEWYTPNFSGISVVRTDGSPGTINDNGSVRASTFRRMLALNTMDIDHPYVLDVFEVEGGETHEYRVVGSAQDSQTFTTNYNVTNDASSNSFGLTEIESGAVDKNGYVQMSFDNDPDIGTRTFFVQDNDTTFIMARGDELRNGGPDKSAQIILRREDSNGELKSTFIALHEMKSGASTIVSFTHQWLSSDQLGITVVTTSGRTDYFVISLNGQQNMSYGPITANAEFAMASIQGAATDLWMIGGNSTSANGKSIYSATAKYVGNVSSPTRRQTGDEQDSFLSDAALPVGESLAGEVALLEFIDDTGKVLFVNPFTILSVEAEGSKRRVIVQEDVAFTIEADKVTEGYRNWREATSIRLRVINNTTSIPKPKVLGDDLYKTFQFTPKVALKDGHNFHWSTNGKPANTEISIDGAAFVPAATLSSFIASKPNATNIRIKEQNVGGIFATKTYQYDVISAFPETNVNAALQSGIWLFEYHAEHPGQTNIITDNQQWGEFYGGRLVSELRNELTLTASNVIKAEGFLEIPTSGLYTFYFHSGGGRFWLDNTLLVDSALHKDSHLYIEAKVYLEAGMHKIDTESFEAASKNELSLDWKGPGIKRQTIPAQYFKTLVYPDIEPTPALNSIPTIDNITVPSTADVASAINITASGSDKNNDPLSYTWRKISGVGSVSFANANSANTTVSFSAAGDYVIQLSVSDGDYITKQQALVLVGAQLDTDGDGIIDHIDTDDDNDGILDAIDAFPLDATESVDSDGDGIGNNKDLDDDNDGILDLNDDLPFDALENTDTDGDGIGNNTDTDDDNDGVLDINDAFPLDQTKLEHPISAELISLLVDTVNSTTYSYGGSTLESTLNDPFLYNPIEPTKTLPVQSWSSTTGFHGDEAEGDDVVIVYDLTNGEVELNAAQTLQVDLYGRDKNTNRTEDFDIELYQGGVGGTKIYSENNVGISRSAPYHLRVELLPTEAFDTLVLVGRDTADDGGNSFTIMELRVVILNDAWALDSDNDGVLDGSDTFPLDPNESLDTDLDGIGNNADTDDDDDGILDVDDDLPLDAGESIDSDGDGIGNNTDTDDDNDGVLDASDAFPFDASESLDTDGDGIGNNTDTDDDGDGVLDASDAFPLDASETLDTDGDGIGNNTDTDDDGDGVIDTNDAFPLDGSETLDTDGDGIGNNADTDDDNDGILDINDGFPLDPNRNLDSDGDGVSDEDETALGRDPLVAEPKFYKMPTIIGQSISEPDFTYTVSQLPQSIAFGSCGEVPEPQPILEDVAAIAPDLFIYLGDNIYADYDMEHNSHSDNANLDMMKAKYDLLKIKPEFVGLKSVSTLMATWDDHDYGKNDAGKNFAYKEQAKALFMDFWQEPVDSPRYSHPGIYTSSLYKTEEQALQIILLDTRTFRDNPPDLTDLTSTASILGTEQWLWLEQQLKIPADTRIIASSIQFGHEHNGYESWRNFPVEHQKMLDLIKSTRANGVLFISGDVHWGEISKVDESEMYPLYDLTSSGINVTWGSLSDNENRVGAATDKAHHYGLLEFDWETPDVVINGSIIDISKTVVTSFVSSATSLISPLINAPIIDNTDIASSSLAGESMTLSVTATDPNDKSLSYIWSKVSGPGEVTFADKNSASTSATFTTLGNYIIKISVDNGTDISIHLASVTINKKTAIVGLWQFENSNDITDASIGHDLQILGGAPSFSSALTDDGGLSLSGITTVQGNTGLRMQTGIAANGGGNKINKYSLLIDLFSPAASRNSWRSLLQTVNSGGDAEYFIDKSDKLGRSTIDYSTNAINDAQWTRLVLSVDLTASGNQIKAYLDGELFHDHSNGVSIDGDYALLTDSNYSQGNLLFGDDNSENAALNISNVAIYDGALTAEEVALLGTVSTDIISNSNIDSDGDGVLDSSDAFPDDASESLDTDGDGIGNNADTDDDNDGVLDINDALPLDANESLDNDLDGIGNNSDTDDDNDGVADASDAFPLDASETIDTDLDGIGNNADTDDDNDGVPDSQDSAPLDPSVGNDSNSSDNDNAETALPGLTIPADIEVHSSGPMTAVDLGVATAQSYTGSRLVPEVSNPGPFAPGRHEIIWRATDAFGYTTIKSQWINVIPQVNVAAKQTVEEGATVTVTVTLNGEAVQYPVDIPYAISGTAYIGTDHNLNTGTLSITAGTKGEITFNTVKDNTAEPNETVIVSLGEPVNAVLGNTMTHRIVISEANLVPKVVLNITQSGTSVAAITADGGLVELAALVTDANAGDNHSYQWQIDHGALTTTNGTTNATMVINPANLDNALYTFSITVTDNGVPATSQTIQEALLVVSNSYTLEDLTDANQNRIPDDQEWLLQDNYLTADDGRLALLSDEGTQLSPGDLAYTLGRFDPVIQPEDLPVADVNFDYFNDLINIRVSEIVPGESVRIVIPQSPAIFANAAYRLYQPDLGWEYFMEDPFNQIRSALAVGGVCPAPGDANYTSGLTEGHQCIELTLQDGGVNDVDGQPNGLISLLGGVASGWIAQPTINSSPNTQVGEDSLTLGSGETVVFGFILQSDSADAVINQLVLAETSNLNTVAPNRVVRLYFDENQNGIAESTEFVVSGIEANGKLRFEFAQPLQFPVGELHFLVSYQLN